VRSWGGIALLVAAGLAAGCHWPGGGGLSGGARLWLEGPVRWLLLPEETRQFRGLAGNREVLAFIEGFWQRRDPTPEDPENPFRAAFLEREAAADRLYGEERQRGSLTDRGRVLILFGSPSILRYRQKAVPVLTPDRPRRRAVVATRRMTQEVWVYLPRDLPPRLLALLPEEERGQELSFVFAIEARRAYLLEGERYCELAASAALLRPP
jgi:GWxTD domain-containing protein